MMKNQGGFERELNNGITNMNKCLKDCLTKERQ